jgi:pyridoxine 5'-phosphate synthase PdxJ
MRLGIDLEPLADLTNLWKHFSLDILDFAYAAASAGAQMLMAPEAKIERTELALLARPGLPLFVLKVRQVEFTRTMQLAPPADRFFVVSDHGEPLKETDDVIRFGKEAMDSSIMGTCVEAELDVIRNVARAGMGWVVFSSDTYAHAATPKEAEDELARLSTAVFAAQKFGLRVAMMGAMPPHLLRPLLDIEGIEELYPGPEIWLRALRIGWERALAEYRDAMRR